MKHWVKISKSTGEHSFVSSDDDKHPTDQGEPKEGYKYTRLDRAPEEHDVFDGKHLKHDAKNKEKSQRIAKLNAMSREELLDFVLNMIDDRLKHHGLISGQDDK